ncbi:MAG: sulfatase-like hydrolase/transferase [Planctomycetota bacterium]
MNRPNVVLMLTDQQRWDTLGAVSPYARTPNLDRLAEEGVLFENAFCNNPVCMPSRQSMLSGRYPSVVGCSTNGVEMDPDVECIHNILGLYGYHTANLGKLHFKNHSNRDHREPHPSYGFDELVLSDEPGCYDDAYIKWVEAKDPSQVENCRCSTPPAWDGPPVEKHPRGTHEPYLFEGPEELTHTAFVAEETAACIRRRAGRGPFFAIAGFYAPHCPVNPPERFVEMVDPSAIPLPAMNEDERDRYGLSDDEWREVRAHYHALVSHVDDQAGRILDALDETGERENTVLVFTSDHGDHLGDHGTVAKGPPGYDSCVHVPLIVAGAGVEPGRRRRELIELVDVAPTLLDLCGVQPPPFFQGRSFRPLLEGTEYTERPSVFIEHKSPFRSSWKTVRTHNFKYCVSAAKEELLFDLREDPHELTNLAAEPDAQPALGAMRGELVRRWFDVENQYPLRTGSY